MKQASTEIVRGDATFSDCGRYRYRLERIWNPQVPILPWVLLNASRADSHRDDPTVRRVTGFTRRWKFGGLRLVNAYAAAATKPRDLFAMEDNIGPDNQRFVQETIRDACRHARSCAGMARLPVIVGWGNHGARDGHDHRVLDWILGAGTPVSVECLGLTRLGCPRHPLYCRSDATRHTYELVSRARRH